MTADTRTATSEQRQTAQRTLNSVLLGSPRTGSQRYFVLLLAISVFVVTFAGYALGIFSVSGGIALVPFYAALVGMVAACWVGYRRGGLVSGWVVAYLSFLGWHAEWALYEVSRRPLPLTERSAYFIQPDGLVALAIAGLVLGTIAFILGALTRGGVDVLRGKIPTLMN